jgi:hypothetical protein
MSSLLRIKKSRRSVAALLSIVAVLPSASVYAAPPAVKNLFPAGGQRGQSIAVTAAGEFPTWPVKIWSDHPGVTAIASQEQGLMQVSIAANATPGVAWLRVYSDDGAANMRPFIVGTLAELTEVEPNDAPVEGQAIDGARVVNGRLQKRGDVDGFAVSLKQGETLIAALAANSHLGSPVDAVLQICELVERRPLADAKPQVEAFVLDQNHDAVGLDPSIVLTAPADGKYLVRVFGFPSQPDSSIAFAGGDEHVYRLTLTTGPYIAATMPLALQEGAPQDVKLVGWNLPESLRSVTPSLDVAFHANAAGWVRLSAVNHPVIIADRGQPKPQNVVLPATVSGQLQRANERHTFRFPVAKGKKLRLTVAAHELGYPIDPKVTITDDGGMVLLEVDDANGLADPQLVFTPPADGHCRVVIGDVAGGAGRTFVYLLTIEPETADFNLTLANDRFTVTADKPLEIPVTVNRREFTEPVAIRVVGLPLGIVAEEAVSQPTGETAAMVKLILKCTQDTASPTSIPISIEGVIVADQLHPRRASFEIGVPNSIKPTAAWLTLLRQ